MVEELTEIKEELGRRRADKLEGAYIKRYGDQAWLKKYGKEPAEDTDKEIEIANKYADLSDKALKMLFEAEKERERAKG